jgi:hypothetical protein
MLLEFEKIMKILVFGLFFIIMTSLSTQAAFFSIDKLENYWGFYLDTLSYAKEESVVFMKADSMNNINSSNKFYTHPSVHGRARFIELPCITFYHLWTGDDRTSPENPYKLIFYNHCNETVYRYGGNIEDFNSVFGQYLEPFNNWDHVMTMINFYLLTQYVLGQTRILKSSEDFNTFFDSLYSKATEEDYPSMWQILREEKPIISQLIKPFKCEKIDQMYRLEFYTYGNLGWIEHWVIKYYPNAIILDKREKIKQITGGNIGMHLK